VRKRIRELDDFADDNEGWPVMVLMINKPGDRLYIYNWSELSVDAAATTIETYLTELMNGTAAVYPAKTELTDFEI